MPSSLSERFVAAVDAFSPSRYSRLRHAPIHLMYSKCLELYARKFRVPVWRQAETFWGDKMQVVFPERVSMTLYRYKFFERGERLGYFWRHGSIGSGSAKQRIENISTAIIGELWTPANLLIARINSRGAHQHT